MSEPMPERGRRERVIGLIAARMDSRRLPGKPLLPVAGRPLLDYVVQRAEQIPGIDRLVVATTDRTVDDPLVRFALDRSLGVFRGAVDDVAARFLSSAEAFTADVLVRINGDCPVLDPALVGDAIARLLEDPTLDIVTNVLERSYPYGVSAEVVRVDALRRAYPLMADDEREHVTAGIYHHTDALAILNLKSSTPDTTQARLVVDTPEDLQRFELAAGLLGDDIAMAQPSVVAALYERQDPTS